MTLDEFIAALEDHLGGSSELSDDAERVGRDLAHLPD